MARSRSKSQKPPSPELPALIYRGPLSAVTLADGREVTLYPGKPADLPPDHPYTLSLIALGRLAWEDPADAS